MAQNRQCVELMASGDLTLPTMAAEMGIVSSVSSCSHHTHYTAYMSICNVCVSSVDCGSPQPPANGFIKTVSSTLEGAVISFQCDQGFSPPEERPATCVRDEDTGSAAWEPNPAEQTCSRNETGTTSPSMYFHAHYSDVHANQV